MIAKGLFGSLCHNGRPCNILATPHKGESITAEDTNIPATKYSNRFLKYNAKNKPGII